MKRHTSACYENCKTLRPLVEAGKTQDEINHIIGCAATAAALPHATCEAGGPVPLAKTPGHTRCDLRMEVQHGVKTTSLLLRGRTS